MKPRPIQGQGVRWASPAPGSLMARSVAWTPAQWAARMERMLEDAKREEEATP